MSSNILDFYQGNVDNFKGITALVVDNFDNMRATITSILKEAGFKRIIVENDGAAAASRLEKSKIKIDLIIADTDLPSLSGLNLLKQTRENPTTSNIPFVMVSASIDEDQVVDAINAGVSEFVVKPFSAQILLGKITKAIKKPVSRYTGAQESCSKNEINILVVDDTPENLQVITKAIRKDYHVRAVTSGDKALKICNSINQPDLILLDIMMPEMSGIEVFKTLKSHARTQHIPVIFLTALSQTQHIVEGLKMGAVDYITKPFIPEVAKARIDNHIKILQGQQSLRDKIVLLMKSERQRQDLDVLLRGAIKQPIAEINEAIKSVQKNASSPTKVRKISEDISAQCERADLILKNILTIKMVEDGSYILEVEPINIQTILNNVQNQLSIRAKSKNIEIMYKIEEKALEVLGNFELLESAIFALLKNAIEAAPRGSAIKVSEQVKNNAYKLSIHNLGAVPPHLRSCFFDKYSTNDRTKGLGLGTYLAKTFIELQDGIIEMKTSDTKGTKINITLTVN